MENTSDQSVYNCSGATDEEYSRFLDNSWWIDGFGQLVLCSIGLTGNTIAIPLLCSRKLNSVFYRLLVYLAVFDNLYLGCSLLEAIRSHYSLPWDKNTHTLIYIYVLYPLHNIILSCSIYLTATIALERYQAVCRPVEYRNRILSDFRSPCRRVLFLYLIPVVLFSVLVNSPKFYELEAMEYKDEFNNTRTGIKPTSLRLNDDYVVYYQNYTRLIVTGILPFCLLAFCNFQIYMAVMRRKQNGGSANDSESRQAIILILIVFIFLLCNTPRIFLTLVETFNSKQWKEDYLRGCKGLPLWLLYMGSYSHLILTLNSSLNFFLYCGLSNTFRGVLKACCLKQSLLRLRKKSSPFTSGVRITQLNTNNNQTLHTEINQDGVIMTSL